MALPEQFRELRERQHALVTSILLVQVTNMLELEELNSASGVFAIPTIDLNAGSQSFKACRLQLDIKVGGLNRLQAVLKVIDPEAKTQKESQMAHMTYFFDPDEQDPRTVKATSSLKVVGVNQGQGIGSALIGVSEQIMRFAFQFYPNHEGLRLVEIVEADSRGEQPDMTGCEPERRGWTEAMVRARKDYKMIPSAFVGGPRRLLREVALE